MAFLFRLQKVLEYRHRLEDEAKRNYMEAQAKTVKALQELEALYVAIDLARSRGHELQTGTSNSNSDFKSDVSSKIAPTLQNIDSFISGQKIRIERQRSVIREVKGEEEQLQDVLIQAARERKTLEKLRERHLEEYRAEVARREQAEIDDITTMRYGRGEGP
jgi:flagellar protein FliJ